MLTIETYKLLKQLKQYENPWRYGKIDNRSSYVIVDFSEFNYNKHNPLRIKGNSITAKVEELNYLEENSYISINGRHINLTHKGNVFVQITIRDFLIWFGKSILTPIAVSYLYHRFLE